MKYILQKVMTFTRMIGGHAASPAWVPAMMIHLFSTPQEIFNTRCVQKFTALGHQRRNCGVRGFSGVSRGPTKASAVPYIEIQDVSSDGWKLTPAIEILKQALRFSASLPFLGWI